MSNNNPPIEPIHPNFDRNDPQIVLMGTLKQGAKSDVIVFRIPLSLFEIVCICTIPEQGTNSAPVYLKFRVNRS